MCGRGSCWWRSLQQAGRRRGVEGQGEEPGLLGSNSSTTSSWCGPPGEFLASSHLRAPSCKAGDLALCLVGQLSEFSELPHFECEGQSPPDSFLGIQFVCTKTALVGASHTRCVWR